MSRDDQVSQLEKMIANYDHNHNRLAKITRDMANKAEDITRANRPKSRQYGRRSATWTGADERYFLDRFVEDQNQRQKEIDALKAKMTRQRLAIEKFSAKLKLNDTPKLREIPVVHAGVWFKR